MFNYLLNVLGQVKNNLVMGFEKGSAMQMRIESEKQNQLMNLNFNFSRF